MPVPEFECHPTDGPKLIFNSPDLLLKKELAIDNDGDLILDGVKVHNGASIKTGTYTGDGTTSQGITGVGFQPKYVRIWPQRSAQDAGMKVLETTDTIVDDNANGGAFLEDGNLFKTNRITSLDVDGFTVDDDGANLPPNKSGQVYNYMALG